MPGAFADFADYFAVRVQLALAATFRALITEQLAGVVTHGTGNLLFPRLEPCAFARWTLDHIWPSRKCFPPRNLLKS